MCLIVVGCALRADYPLIVAANRDEFFARPTEAAHFWPDAPEVLAGRDREAGGTWLGLTRSGRFAALTNFRDGTRRGAGKRSRGWLVRDYLASAVSAEAFLEGVHARRDEYDGFNLLLGGAAGLYHYSNRGGGITRLAPGVHGLSNHLLNTPWPKVERAKAHLAQLADAAPAILNQRLFDLLADDRQAADETLPETGVSLEWERLLSSAFIRAPGYGTRSSTTVLVAASGAARFEERTFSPEQTLTAQRIEVLA
jgi:uncharacterized protein with NRDE domain